MRPRHPGSHGEAEGFQTRTLPNDSVGPASLPVRVVPQSNGMRRIRNPPGSGPLAPIFQFAKRQIALVSSRMSGPQNPALKLFLEGLGSECVLAQVLIRPRTTGFELRQVADRDAAPEALRTVPVRDLRSLAQFTADGAFRPLKAAPNLPTGWRTLADDDAALEEALHHLYPGAMADWYAARQPSPPITHYRDFTNRQTGMYRITQMLDDALAGRMIEAACYHDSCLKQRLWTVDGLASEEPATKSLIPCLEPCAVLMEFARQAMRIAQEDSLQLEAKPSELRTLVEVLQQALDHPDPKGRDGNVADDCNPRRLRLLMASLKARLPAEDEN